MVSLNSFPGYAKGNDTYRHGEYRAFVGAAREPPSYPFRFL
jgi:hypothetical protein